MMTLRHKILTLLSAILMIGHTTHAQTGEISFTTNLSKQKLGINERLQVKFTMNKDGDNFNPPNFSGFKVIMGPSQAISSSWINGKRSFSKTYTYTLAPTARGRFTIGQATIEIGGATYKTLPKTVEVTAAVNNPNTPATANDIARKKLHFVAEISKRNPYLNEAVTVTYKLYVSPEISISNYQPLDNPTYHNFWSQDIPVTTYSPRNGTYQGKPYRYVVLKKVILYPQQAGKLEIEPFSLEVSVDVPTNRRNFFGLRTYTQINQTVSTGRQTLRVKPLPEAGKPADFGGAVGDFNFSVTPSKTQLNASESLQASVEVSGKGNLKLFQLPELKLPGTLEVYEPEYEEEVYVLDSGMEGKVTHSYTIVPAFRGKYPIPSIPFSYFNPKTKKYVTLHSENITIEVPEGPAPNPPSDSATTNSQSIAAVEKSFHFIKLNPDLQAIHTKPFFGSTIFYTLWLAPLLLLPLTLFLFKKREAFANNVESHRIRRANRLARKYLSTTKKALGHKEAFYVAMEKGLHNYLKAKLQLETSEFSKEKITRILHEKNVTEETVNGFIALLKSCEIARYSPFSNVQMQNDYTKASTIISNLDKQL